MSESEGKPQRDEYGFVHPIPVEDLKLEHPTTRLGGWKFEYAISEKIAESRGSQIVDKFRRSPQMHLSRLYYGWTGFPIFMSNDGEGPLGIHRRAEYQRSIQQYEVLQGIEMFSEILKSGIPLVWVPLLTVAAKLGASETNPLSPCEYGDESDAREEQFGSAILDFCNLATAPDLTQLYGPNSHLESQGKPYLMVFTRPVSGGQQYYQLMFRGQNHPWVRDYEEEMTFGVVLGSGGDGERIEKSVEVAGLGTYKRRPKVGYRPACQTTMNGRTFEQGGHLRFDSTIPQIEFSADRLQGKIDWEWLQNYSGTKDLRKNIKNILKPQSMGCNAKGAWVLVPANRMTLSILNWVHF